VTSNIPGKKAPASDPGSHRLLVRLTPAEERALRRKHPELDAAPPAIKPRRGKTKPGNKD